MVDTKRELENWLSNYIFDNDPYRNRDLPCFELNFTPSFTKKIKNSMYKVTAKLPHVFNEITFNIGARFLPLSLKDLPQRIEECDFQNLINNLAVSLKNERLSIEQAESINFPDYYISEIFPSFLIPEDKYGRFPLYTNGENIWIGSAWAYYNKKELQRYKINELSLIHGQVCCLLYQNTQLLEEIQFKIWSYFMNYLKKNKLEELV